MWLEPRAGGESTARPAQFTRAADLKPRSSAKGQAFDRLYRQEVQALRMYTNRLVRDGGDAEDIVQEAFVRLWRVLDDEAIKSPRAVLFTTARNLGLNHIRNKRVRNTDAAQWASGEAFRQTQTTAEEQLIATEDADACRGWPESEPPVRRPALLRPARWRSCMAPPPAYGHAPAGLPHNPCAEGSLAARSA